MKRSVLSLLLLSLLVPGTAFAKKKQPKAEPAPVAAPAPVDPEAWRATRPGPTAAPAWVAPSAKMVTLANGIPVYVLENPSLPLLSVRVVMTIGREANPAGKAGLAALTANLLDEGTKTLSAEQIAERSASLGAELGVYSGDEVAMVYVDALTGEALGPSLDLLADVTLNPKFDSKQFARVQKETLASIQEAKAEPRDVVARVFAAQLYGKNHPYGVPGIGDETSVKALKQTDVTAFYKQWWHAGNAAIVVSGATTPDEIKTLLDARFGAWKKGTSTRPTPAAASVPLKTRVVFVEQPGAVQSVLRVGTVGTPRTAPDFMAANLAGTLCCGMFSSRLNMNLREEKGWSYGAFGGFSESRDAGVFAARTSVQADKTGPAVAEIMAELQSAAAKTPVATDLEMARDSILKSLPGYFETNGATSQALAAIPSFGLGVDAWPTYQKEMTAVTLSQVTAASGTYFDPARMLVVVVGPKSIEVDDGKGGKTTVDVVQSLKDLGYEFVAL